MRSNSSTPAGQHNRPLVAAGYRDGIGGGVGAIEHLARMVAEAEMVPFPTVAVRRSCSRCWR